MNDEDNYFWGLPVSAFIIQTPHSSGAPQISALMALADPPPGTPVADDAPAIAARLKEIEAEKVRERQAEEKKS